MNNLEEFIKANREEFDHKEPRDKLWPPHRVGLGSQSRIRLDMESCSGVAVGGV